MAAMLIGVMASLPLRTQCEQPIQPAHNPGPPEKTWVAVCLVIGAGLAVGAVYILSKKCKPKYYWLRDEEQPPNTWVGTCTVKEAQINGWHKFGGPYDKPSDAPTNAPPLTNVVSEIMSANVLTTTVETSQDGSNWTPVYTETGDSEDFVYYPTNTGMFRLMGSP